MSKDQQSVELNGRVYDAKTGKPVSVSAVKKAVSHKSNQSTRVGVGKNLDGVTRKATPTATSQKRVPQRSKTLMRHVVKKPVVPKVERATPKAKHELPTTQAEDTPSIIIKPQHVIHASGVTRSKLISKFGNALHATKTDIVPVQDPPVAHTGHAAPSTPPITVATPIKDDLDPIRQALEQAPTHIHPRHTKISAYHKVARTLHIRPSSLTAVLVGITLVGVASYFTYTNIPHIALRVASERTGIKAAMPHYSPAGYSLTQPVHYDSSQIRLEYASNSDTRGFDVVQKASSWDSKSLLENYVVPSGHQYQKLQLNGRAVYVLDNGDATWVDGGTWYEIKANASLSNDQILKIVNGL